MSWYHHVIVDPNMTVNGDRFALVVRSQIDAVTAITAIHRQDFSRRIGGARFVENGSLAEVAHLASAMTDKCLAAKLPMDGEKTIIICPDGIPQSIEARATILRQHILDLVQADPGAIIGPDMANPQEVLDIISTDPVLRDHVTGLSETHGGLGIDKHGYTAVGLACAIDVARERCAGLNSAVIQGFGAVGAHTARHLAQMGIAVKAISNQKGTLIGEDGRLDVESLFMAWQTGGDQAVIKAADAAGGRIRLSGDPDELLSVNADIFIPAARTCTLAMPNELLLVREENPAVQDVTAFYRRSGVRLISQGANHPLTEEAERYLETTPTQVMVQPDYIINCGGLIGCYFEWAFRDRLLSDPSSCDIVAEAAKGFIRDSIRSNVVELFRLGGGAREAARQIVVRNRKYLSQLSSRQSESKDVHALAQAALNLERLAS